MASTSIKMANNPAAGTPANIMPRPPSIAWINAIPITPTATERIVEVDISSSSSP